MSFVFFQNHQLSLELVNFVKKILVVLFYLFYWSLLDHDPLLIVEPSNLLSEGNVGFFSEFQVVKHGVIVSQLLLLVDEEGIVPLALSLKVSVDVLDLI